jgi:hypothetical protein
MLKINAELIVFSRVRHRSSSLDLRWYNANGKVKTDKQTDSLDAVRYSGISWGLSL